MLIINNLATADDYTRELTLDSAFGGRLVYLVANASVLAQWRRLPEAPGSRVAEYEQEQLLPPQTSFIDKISAARFRSAVAGSPARIVATLSEPGDILPASGTPFTATLQASGGVVQAALTAYTPTWTASVLPNPTIGNGVLEGRFFQSGAFVFAWFHLSIGTTTTLGGGGTWNFSLPVALGGGITEILGHGRIYDSSVGTIATCSWLSDGRVLDDAAGLAAIVLVGPASPMIWAAGDDLHSFLVYGSA